jgi:F0F1-type ATP synthase membrane subunit c/vacuolar-type H+-ATPase subunit K
MIVTGFNPKQAYRALKLIFYALNTGLLVFFLVGIFLNGMTIPEFSDRVDILTIINVLMLAAIPAGYSISTRKMAAIEPKDSFARKFEQFQTAMIIRWAMIEGVALLSLVGFIILQDAKQLILFVFCVLALSMNTVTREKTIRWAKLSPEEAKALED